MNDQVKDQKIRELNCIINNRLRVASRRRQSLIKQSVQETVGIGSACSSVETILENIFQRLNNVIKGTGSAHQVLVALADVYEALPCPIENVIFNERISIVGGPVAEHVLKMSALLPYLWTKNGKLLLSVHGAKRLAASQIFKTAIIVKYNLTGLKNIVRIELIAYIILFICFFHLSYSQFVRERRREWSEILTLIPALILCFLFTIREAVTLLHLSHHENGILASIARVPLLLLTQFWNLINCVMLGTMAAYLIDTTVQHVRRGNPPTYDKYDSKNDWDDESPSKAEKFGREKSPVDSRRAVLTMFATLFSWIRLLGMLRFIMNKRFIGFIAVLERIILDVREFTIALFIFIAAFAHIALLANGRKDREHFGFDDEDDKTNEFRTIPGALQYFYLLSFLGASETALFRNSIDILALDLFIFVVYLILLNVLIAVISEAYDRGMADADAFFWRSRHELIAQYSRPYNWLLRPIPEAAVRTITLMEFKLDKKSIRSFLKEGEDEEDEDINIELGQFEDDPEPSSRIDTIAARIRLDVDTAIRAHAVDIQTRLDAIQSVLIPEQLNVEPLRPYLSANSNVNLSSRFLDDPSQLVYPSTYNGIAPNERADSSLISHHSCSSEEEKKD